ncbi:MAG TPA: regulatory iron-sulfur-containing complex subunit RicT [Phycisphaerae bacterium]|nr:regulatory iron-sulfur-containing complex subunit RicT [Phycisphaerae bacterium]
MGSRVSDGDNAEATRGERGSSSTICDPDALGGGTAEGSHPTCAVRYGYMQYIGEFRYSPGTLNGCGLKVVVQTNRGIELGEQVSLTCSGCRNSISRQQMQEYVKNSEAPEFFQPKAGRILRRATPQDLIEDAKIKEDGKEKLARARQLATSLNLDMKLIACEHLFGGERIIFHFMSESRVDFRELVRELAHEYHTRIEMHQVGARDEARLIADYEMCGRECCCKNFLKKLRPVTMRMAKLQKATLDPSKVSGRCGRLRCCLRYEYEGYDELNKKLPRIGGRVRTEKGIGTVKDRQVLTQLVSIIYDERDLEEVVPVEQILERNLPKKPPPPAADESSAAELQSRPRRESAAAEPMPARGGGDRPTRPVQRPRNVDGPNAGPAHDEKPSAAAPAEAGTDADRASQPEGSEPARRGRRRGRRSRRRGRRQQADGSNAPNSGNGSSDAIRHEQTGSDGGIPDSA